MIKATDFVLPVLVAFIVGFGAIKGVKVFECFVDGAKKGIKTAVGILPPLIALIVAVDMLRCSGALEIICDFMSPVAELTGIPKEVLPLTILSPVSGSGAVSMYESILAQYGADSQIGRIASILMGSTETTLYAVTLYYGSVGIKKTRYTLPCAVAADFTSFVLSARLVTAGF